MLNEKQIKLSTTQKEAMKKLTSMGIMFENYRGDSKCFAYTIRFGTAGNYEDRNLTVDIYTGTNDKIVKEIVYTSSDYYGQIQSNRLPVKWLAPLAKILEEK